MTPEFAQPVNKIFDAVLDLIDRIERREKPDLNQEKALIRQDLDTLLSARGPSQRSEELELVQRALIYWVDEVLTAAQVEWKDMTLEFDYYAERDRAWRFYEYGERFARFSSSDVIETWYLCLVLGFEGDIGEACREHLHRKLPGDASTSSQARVEWASELARLIRKPSSTELVGEPIVGGVEPLTSAAFLNMAIFILAFGVVLWFLIVPVLQKLSTSQ